MKAGLHSVHWIIFETGGLDSSCDRYNLLIKQHEKGALRISKTDNKLIKINFFFLVLHFGLFQNNFIIM